MAPPRSLHYRTGWFRVWNSILNNPKISDLDDRTFRNWIEMLCVASLYRGSLPTVKDFAFELRINPAKAERVLSRLLALNLIDEIDEQYVPHDWLEHQPPSDNSTDRVQRHRERNRNAGNVSETPPDTESETDSKKHLERELEAKAEANAPKRFATTREALKLFTPISQFGPLPKKVASKEVAKLSDEAKDTLKKHQPSTVPEPGDST